jgi:hypothetical protein
MENTSNIIRQYDNLRTALLWVMSQPVAVIPSDISLAIATARCVVITQKSAVLSCLASRGSLKSRTVIMCLLLVVVVAVAAAAAAAVVVVVVVVVVVAAVII